MNCKPLISGTPLVEIERSRYDELVAQEEELRLLKIAILNVKYSSELESIEKIFNITPNIEAKTESEEINND